MIPMIQDVPGQTLRGFVHAATMPGRPGFATADCRRTDLADAFGISEILLAARPKSVIYVGRPASSRGAFRDRHGRGRRDAVDAGGAFDERR